jgi:hypothetical protein
MSMRRPFHSVIALVAFAALAISGSLGAQGTQEAGKISVVVPTAYLVRASQQLNAAAAMPVLWGDVVNTGHLARARISLTDGSVLNVGSDSNLTVAKHDAAAQQTDLDLNYGRVRAKAVKLVKPDSHFQIRTSVGVAGVVGTEMIVGFDSTPTPETPAAPAPTTGIDDRRKMTLICLEGQCNLCDNNANCILMKGGEISTIRGNSAPAQPTPVTPLSVTQAVNSTSATGATGAAGVGGLGVAGTAAVGTAVGTGVAIGVVRAVAKTTSCPPVPPPPSGGVVKRPAAGCGGITQGGVKINGQRGP